METLLAKISLFFSLILGSLGSAYIGLDTTSLNFDFRTGDSEPVYWLAVTNRGPQKARFSLTDDADWITVYRETQPGVTAAEINQTGTIAFVVEIHPRQLADGSHRGRVTIKAFNPLGYEEELDSREVSVTLNKNLPIPALTTLPAATLALPPTPSLLLPEISLTPKILAPPKVKSVPSATPTVRESPVPFKAISTKTPASKTSPILQREAIFQTIIHFFRNLFF